MGGDSAHSFGDANTSGDKVTTAAQIFPVAAFREPLLPDGFA